MIEVRDVRLPLDGDLRSACAKKLGVKPSDVVETVLLRRSVDARKKTDVHFLVSAAVRPWDFQARVLEWGAIADIVNYKFMVWYGFLISKQT